MPDWLQTYLQSLGANQPISPMGAPSYGTGPGVLGMADPMRLTGVPGAPSMGYPAAGILPPDPRGSSLTVSDPRSPATNASMPAHPMSPAPMLPFESGFPSSIGPAVSSPYTPMPWRGPIADQPTTNVGAPAPAIPPPRPKGKIDPKKVDLGMNQRFVPIQYQVPSGRGPLGNNPIYTALNLGGQS